MKIRRIFPVALMMALLAAAAVGQAAEVAQGQCLAYSAETRMMKIEEYDTNFSREAPYGNPTGIISQFDLARAKVGLSPEKGDVVRIAYEIKEDRKVALKVMNVSKQDLRKK